MKICIGIKNSHEPNFFKVFTNYLEQFGHEINLTAQQYIEVVPLVEKMNLPYKVIGKHYGKGKLRKGIGFLANNLQYYFQAPSFDVSLSHGNPYLIQTSRFRGKPTICFTDNDINVFNSKLTFPYINYLLTPAALNRDTLVSLGARERSIQQFNGYKEDLYVANFKPDPDFMEGLPFDEFVTVRAESLKAIYVPGNTKTIVPDLLRNLEQKGINVLFLPRYESDKKYAQGLNNVYMPPEPLNGLDVCYYSNAVLTGAGTFAREAACLGTPAVSFFPGRRLLAVDQQMVNDGRMLHTRKADEIVDYVMKSNKNQPDLQNSKKVLNEVFDMLDQILVEVEPSVRSRA